MSKKLLDSLEALERKIGKTAIPFFESEKKSIDLRASLPKGQLFIGMIGFPSLGKDFSFLDGVALLRPVANPPGIIHIARAADLKKSDYLGVGRFSHLISNELVLGSLDQRKEVWLLLEIAWQLAVLLKLLGPPSLLAPVYSTQSWDAICAIKDNSVAFGLLDDQVRRLSGFVDRAVTPSDLEWVRKHWEISLEMRNANAGKRFSLALACVNTWNHTVDPRVGIANLWIGLDALFGSKTDKPVTGKLVRKVHNWIDGAFSDSRISELYEMRCDAIHGRPLEKANIAASIRDTLDLLSKSLIKAIELGCQPIPDEL